MHALEDNAVSCVSTHILKWLYRCSYEDGHVYMCCMIKWLAHQCPGIAESLATPLYTSIRKNYEFYFEYGPKNKKAVKQGKSPTL